MHPEEVHDPEVMAATAPPSARAGIGMAIAPPDRPAFLERWNPKEEMERVEHRIAVAEKILLAAGRLLKPSDFVKMGPTCYLQSKGVDRIEKLLGMIFPDPLEEVFIEHDDGEFTAVVRGYAGSRTLNTTVYEMGARSSSEGFFDKFDDDGKRLPVARQLVMKAALSNYQVRSGSRLLGVQGLTAQELSEVLGPGFDATKIGEVSYKTGGKGGKQGAAQNAPDKFGPDADRGKPWKDVSDAGLQYYKKAAEKNLGDASKEKYHNIEKARLEAVNLELNKRQAEPGE